VANFLLQLFHASCFRSRRAAAALSYSRACAGAPSFRERKYDDASQLAAPHLRLPPTANAPGIGYATRERFLHRGAVLALQRGWAHSQKPAINPHR
jgi:hypothetical protein